MKAEAELAEIELAKEREDLIQVEAVRQVWGELVIAAKSRLLSIPAKLAPVVAVEDAPATCKYLVEEQITEARREGQRIMDQTREAAERYRTEEMDKARQEAEAFVERAKADIQRERDTALEEVRASFGDLAITAAERVIRTSLDRSAHESLIAQVLEEGESLRRG